MEKTLQIWAIILAAGESKRMMSPKMLLPFRGSTIIETVITNAGRSEVDGSLVVLGAFREEIGALIRNRPVIQCFNEYYKLGMLSSVKCGFRNLPPECSAALVFQGDQPLIEPVVINTVISSYRKWGKRIVIPVCNGKRGHPLLIDCRLKDAVAELDDAEGLRSLAGIYPDDVLEVETNSPSILKDFDTIEDYQNEINQKN
ncbi:MAG: nucleotidyltransferase family protein [Bacteroidales bacterium]